MKYQPLATFLGEQTAPVVELTFSDVEAIIGSALPRSAKAYPAWWANHAAGHVNAQAWLGAGFRAEDVDLAGQRLRFRKIEAAVTRPNILERLRAALGGTVTIPPGVDLTEPTGDTWDADR